MSNAAQVLSNLNYTVDNGRPLVVYTFKPPEGAKVELPVIDQHEMAIEDVRGNTKAYSLNENGFCYLEHETAVTDFWNQEQVLEVYYAEVRALLLKELGASEVCVFDHNLRSKGIAKQNTIARTPVKSVHNDYTEISGPQRVRDLLSPEDAEERLNKRYMFVNVWRPIEHRVEESPLAVCDGTSRDQSDFLPITLRYERRDGQVYQVRHNPAHKWYYLSKMEPRDVLLLKCFDSDDNAKVKYTAHTAFRDPTSPKGARPRQSIEVRTIVFFD